MAPTAYAECLKKIFSYTGCPGNVSGYRVLNTIYRVLHIIYSNKILRGHQKFLNIPHAHIKIIKRHDLCSIS